MFFISIFLTKGKTWFVFLLKLIRKQTYNTIKILWIWSETVISVIHKHQLSRLWSLILSAKYFLTGMLGTSALREREIYLSRRLQTKVLCKQREQTGPNDQDINMKWPPRRWREKQMLLWRRGRRDEEEEKVRKRMWKVFDGHLKTDRGKSDCSEVSLCVCLSSESLECFS